MSVVLAILAALFLLDALRLRGRAAALAVLAPSSDDVSPDHRFLVAPGVTLDAATERAASAHARREGLAVLDLVPGDLGATPLLGVVQLVDVARFRRDRLAIGRTAAHATLVTTDVLTRSGVSAAPPASPAAFIKAVVRLKRCACTGTDVAVAPGLRALPDDGARRLAVILGVLGGLALPILIFQGCLLGFLLAGPLLAPTTGILALASFHLQPLVVLAGQRVSPTGLWQTTLLRAPLELARLVGLAFARRPVATEPDAALALRPVYEALLAEGTARFFEPRRATCPLCDGGALKKVIETIDLFQHKPGRFRLDRCAACDHVFQNPRLSLDGLSFYYRDFYDGLGEEQLEMLFGFSPDPYLARAGVLRGHAEPSRWLDVGGGHGHFCCVAREVWPQARFDGLDFGDAIEDAARRGWVDEAHRGLFPEIAPGLAGAHDVVSMFHYLEHTRDPRAEIAAAAVALRPGGHLLIEVPDPESRLASLLGRLWMPWLQPQHQHFVSAKNMGRLLEEQGFSVVLWQRGEAHVAADLFFATTTLLDRLAPPGHLPWMGPRSLMASVWRVVVWTVGAPVAAIARLLDIVTQPLFRRKGWSNAYRVLARKTGA